MAVVDNIIAFGGGNITLGTGATGLIVTDESGNILYKALYSKTGSDVYNVTDVAIDGYNNVYAITNDWNDSHSSFGQAKLNKTDAGGALLATKDDSSYFYEYANVRYVDNDIVLTEKATIGGDYTLVKLDKDDLSKTFESATSDYVNNLDLDKNGYAYIAHTDSIKKYDTNGTSPTLVWTSFSGTPVKGVHVAEDGGALSIVAEDTSVDYPYFINPSTGASTLKITAAAGALSSVIYSDDTMGVVLPASVKKYNAAGSQVWSTSKTSYSTRKRATVDSSDTLWVGASDTVYRGWDSSGTDITNTVTTAGSTTEVSARNAWWGAYYRDSVTLTATNSAYLSDSQKKFGNSSLYGDNTGWLRADSLVVPQTGDFTIECFFRSQGSWPSGYTTLFSNYDSAISNGSFHISVYQGQLNIFLKDTVNGNFSYAGTSVTTNTWHHIAIVRSNNAMSVHYNGTRIYNDASQPTTINNNNLYIGARQYGFLAPTYLKCYIDEIRISDSARYTSATYTVPTTTFKADANSLLLSHFEGDNNATIFYDDNSYIDFNEPTQHFITLSDVFNVGTTLTVGAKQVFRALTTTVSSAASLATQSAFIRSLSAAVTSSSSLNTASQYIKQLVTTVTSASSVGIQRAYNRVLSTTVNSVSSLSSLKGKILNLAATVASSASLSSTIGYVRTLTASVTSAASLGVASVILRILSTGVSASTSIAKSVGKSVNTTISSLSDAYRILPDVALQAAVTITTSIQKVVTKSVNSSATATTSMQKAITKGIDAVANSATSMQKAVGSSLSAAITTASSLTKVATYVRALNTTVTSASNILKRVNAGISLAVGVNIGGSLTKLVSKSLNASVGTVSSLRKAITKVINDVLITTETLTRPIIKIYETLILSSVIVYLKERVDDILRKTSVETTDTTNPTETDTFTKGDDA